MATAPVCDFGRPAPPFDLPATDGSRWTLDRVAGPKGTLVMFICNHCPYVLSVLDKIVRDARDLAALGIGSAAICSNDAAAYPADSFPEMRRMAAEKDFPFPYLHDEDQSVGRAYGAVCTPDFFGFDAAGGLQYRGRLDSAGRKGGLDNLPRDLFEGMSRVAETGRGPAEQMPAVGCSIKWKDNAW
ncbi:thioredoxin family protein [Oceaniglobus roseus]|uniref:thioredoxin family protein n=1 Tax=Oceaniglobus roseus TaxID=1737570 RepID=UPI000C7EFFBF|nr:thioredoxin family protein [Kandeliimicrobium roseum]